MSQIKTASIVSYLTIFTNIIVGIGLTPFILSSLGKSEYGLYMLVGSLIGYLALLDFGLNSTTVRFVSKYRHEKNKDKRRAAIVLNNIGNVYCDQENFNKALIKRLNNNALPFGESFLIFKASL